MCRDYRLIQPYDDTPLAARHNRDRAAHRDEVCRRIAASIEREKRAKPRSKKG